MWIKTAFLAASSVGADVTSLGAWFHSLAESTLKLYFALCSRAESLKILLGFGLKSRFSVVGVWLYGSSRS